MTRDELKIMALVYVFMNPHLDIVIFGEQPHARPFLAEARIAAADALLGKLPEGLRCEFMTVRHLCDMGLV
jgi:hypothetical protein